MNLSFTKRLAAALLSLSLTAALAAPAVLAQEVEPAVVEIATADQLEALARDCRLDSWSRGRTVALTADLDLTDSDFAGIPTFGGTFQGNHHTITGVSLTDEGSVQGMFRYLQQDALVQDLTVEGTVQPGGSRTTVGGLVGQNAGTLQNCTFRGTVHGTTRIGGLAGSNTVTGTITGCTVQGNVSGDHFVGGVAGQNDGVISGCTNEAAVNTALSENEVKLEDLTLTDLLTTERAADITDIGGIAGHSAGVIRGCVNRGAVGYDHIGYNVGGLAGSQTGYIEGCVNYGTIHARKEGGGVVGQMEPSGVLQYSPDTLQQLQGELDTLQGLMNQATQDASASSSELNARFADLQSRVESARTAVDTLLEQVKNGVDIGTRNLTVTALAELTGQGSAAGGVGAGGSVQSEESSSTQVTVDPGATPAPTPAPEETPAPTAAPTEEPTPAPTMAPTPAPTPESTPATTPEPTAAPESLPEEAPARGEEAHGRPPHRAPSLEIDRESSSQTEGAAGLGGGTAAQGDAALDGQASVTVPSVELNNRDAITAARNSLSGSLTSIADGVNALNADTGDHTQALIRDIQAITQQLNTISNTLLGAAENAGQGTLFEDVSDEDTDGDTEGKVFNCLNAGAVYADRNAGGITGAMARENDLDPEDDTRISGSNSLHATYKTRIVVRDCTNQGTVQAQKQCAGGIVGSMELGTVLQSRNTADLQQGDGVDYVGGIAGQSRAVIRQCAVKGRLAGNRWVGGIAGSGYTLTDCRALVEATGSECVGAIAGTLAAQEDPTNWANRLQDNTGTVTGNCFVSETLGGIDGVSYAGQAEPVAFADFADRARQEGLPEEFSTLTLTFVADGQTVAVVPVDYGADFDPSQTPALPEKAGYTAAWPDFVRENITFDQTVTAVYTPYAAVIQSDARREDGRPVLLAEGSFPEGTLTAAPLEDTAPAGAVDSWQFTLPQGGEDAGVTLHYLPGKTPVTVYLRGADGHWRKADTTTDGSYLVCPLQTGDDALAAVPVRSVPLPLVAAALAALCLVLALGWRARRRHTAKTGS